MQIILSADGTITVYVDAEGRTFTVGNDHPNYEEILDCVRNDDEDTLVDLLNIKEKINALTFGKVTVTENEVLYNGRPLHNTEADRVLRMASLGLPLEGMCNFIDNVEQNPSFNSRTSLYDFLEKNEGHPITEDGHFLAYKAVRNTYLDKYSGTIDNTPGNIVEIQRNQVDDRRENECSYGLHVGNLEYVRIYGNCPTDKFVLVKVNPADVVSVPKDYNCQKMRVCKYEVLRDYTASELLPGHYYTSDGQEIKGREFGSCDVDDIDWDESQDYDDYGVYDDDDVDNSYDEERNEGYDEGYDNGYEKGMNRGYDAGFDDGLEEARRRLAD